MGDVPGRDGAGTADQHATQEVDEAANIPIEEVCMGMLMRGQRLDGIRCRFMSDGPWSR